MKKRLLCFFFLLLPMVAKASQSGSCGKNLIWTFNSSTQTLIISGKGEMYEYSTYPSPNSPWYNFRTQIKTIIIEEGVTSLGKSAFYDCTDLTSVTIGESVTSIGDYAFQDCTCLTSIMIPQNVISIGVAIFAYCI